MAALSTQPVGAMFALLTAMGAVTFGYATVTGASLRPLGSALWRPRSLLLIASLILVGWIYKLVLTCLY